MTKNESPMELLAAKEKAIIEKYPHALPGTLCFITEEKKFAVMIRCQHPGCEEKRLVRTSDLFQVKTCKEHAKKASKKSLLSAAAPQVSSIDEIMEKLAAVE